MYDQAKSKTEIVLNEEEDNKRYFPLFTKLQSNATSKSNNFIVGNNILSTRLLTLNNKIDLTDLNLSLDTFKIKYKEKLLKLKTQIAHCRNVKLYSI